MVRYWQQRLLNERKALKKEIRDLNERLEFIKQLNTCHPTIKFDFNYSKRSVNFLDTTVYKNIEQNQLLTTIYRKPTDRRNFLHPKSAHPKTLINSIPFSHFA